VSSFGQPHRPGPLAIKYEIPARALTVHAFDQLTRLARSRKYRETASALGAVKELSAFFKAYSSVERVAAVSRGVVEVQNVLRAQVMREFEEA
jgi:hypothetical protein